MRDPLVLVALAGALGWALARLLGWEYSALAAGLPVALLAPGLAALRLARLRLDPPERFVLAVAISPPLSAGLVVAAGLAGAPLPEAMGIVLAVSLLLLLAVPRVAADGAATAPAGVAMLSLLSGALVAIPMSRPFVRNWSDGWFHAAVAAEVAVRGVPPGFPHLAGEALPYPWLFHAWLAALGPWLAVGPLELIAALNVVAAVLTPWALWLLARALGATPAAAVASAVVFMLGVHPLGPVLLVARNLVGVDVGLHALAQNVATASDLLNAVTWGNYYFASSLWARFWTPTAFNFALVIAAAALAVAARAWRGGRLTDHVLLAAAVGMLFLWHALTACAVVVGLAGAAVAGGLVERAPRKVLWMGLACVAGFALAAPYLGFATQGLEGSAFRIAPTRENFMSLVLAGGPMLALAIAGWRSRDAGWGAPAWAAGLAAALMAAMLLLDFPGIGEDKLFYPVAIVLAALAGPAALAAVRRGGPARAAVVAFGVLGLVSALLFGATFLGDPRTRRSLFTASDPEVELYTPDEALALQWIREQSPRNAVFLQPRRPSSIEPILVDGQRRLYLGFAEIFYRITLHPRRPGLPVKPRIQAEIDRRARLQADVFSARPLGPEGLHELARGPGPLYIWWDRELADGALSPTISGDPRRFQVELSTPQVTILRVGP